MEQAAAEPLLWRGECGCKLFEYRADPDDDSEDDFTGMPYLILCTAHWRMADRREILMAVTGGLR